MEKKTFAEQFPSSQPLCNAVSTRILFYIHRSLSLSSRFLKFALLGRPAYSSKHSWQNGSACGRIIFRAPLWLLYRPNSCLAWQRAAHIHITALCAVILFARRFAVLLHACISPPLWAAHAFCTRAEEGAKTSRAFSTLRRRCLLDLCRWISPPTHNAKRLFKRVWRHCFSQVYDTFQFPAVSVHGLMAINLYHTKNGEFAHFWHRTRGNYSTW